MTDRSESNIQISAQHKIKQLNLQSVSHLMGSSGVAATSVDLINCETDYTVKLFNFMLC